MTQPSGRGYFQHPDDPYGVERWFDGRGWTSRTTGTPRPQDPRVEAERPVDPATARYRAYARVCADVLMSVDACAAHANAVMSGRSLPGHASQHEFSARRFRELTAVSAAEFVPSYKAFLATCEVARQAAVALLGSAPDVDHERELEAALTVSRYREVGLARVVMGTPSGPTPRRFLESLAVANEEIEADIYVIGEPGFVGRIHVEPAPTHRACTWCAEQVLVAAVICRYCGRRLHDSGPPDPASILTKRAPSAR